MARADGVDHVCQQRVLEQVAPRAGFQGLPDVAVPVVRREREHVRGGKLGGDRANRGDAVHDRHTQVHEHDVRAPFAAQRHGPDAVLGLGHQLEIDGPGGTSLTVYVQNAGEGTPHPGDEVRLRWRPEHTFVV